MRQRVVRCRRLAPDDFKDYDIRLSPIAATVHGVPAIIAGGKMGDVYAFNSATGTLLWKTPVGVHNGHDNDSALLLSHKLTIKFPYTFEPGPLGGVLTDMAVADGSIYLATAKVEWDTRVPTLPLGAATVSNDLVVTTLYNGELLALNRSTGAIVYQRKLPTSTNSPITVAGNTILVPAGGPKTSATGGGSPRLVAYTVR